MNIYNIYTNPNDPNQIENTVFIKEGFSLFAAIFHLFWAVYHKIWLVAGILAAIEILLAFLYMQGHISYGISEALKVGILLLLGANASDLRAHDLEKKSYIFQGIISGKNEDDARYKYMTHMVQCSTFGAGQGLASLV